MGAHATFGDDQPLPREVAPGPGWCAQMVEMAAHIGAYETLLLSDQLGGREFYVPADPARSPFLALLGAEKAARLSWVYKHETIVIPIARNALRAARRAPVLAAIRAGHLPVAQAARMLGYRRDYLSKLVNRTDEGRGAAPPIPARRGDRRQLDMFGDA